MANYNKGRRKFGVMLTYDFFHTAEVFQMARDTGLSRGDVAHCCHCLWVWSREQFPDAPGVHPNTRTADLELVLPSGLHAPGVSRELLPARFLSAMAAVKWLLIDGMGVVFPKADKYITLGTPQERAAERQHRSRHNRNRAVTSSRESHTDVTHAQNPRPEGPTPPTQVEPQSVNLTPDILPDPTPPVTSSRESHNDVTPPYTNTILNPLTPFQGGKLVGEIRAECDAPEMALEARKVVRHYRARVRTAHPPGGAVLLVMNLLAAGLTPDDLRARCDRYAKHCDRLGTPPDRRQGAGTFFSAKGHHASFADGADSPDAGAGFTLPPRIEGTLRLPPNDPRNAPGGPQDARKAS